MKRILFAIILLIFLTACSTQQPATQTQAPSIDLSGYPYEGISEGEVRALRLAINDEYKARATYQKVIEKFGDMRPFSNIINAESTHIESLKALYDKYNLKIPEDSWYDEVPEFDSVVEACNAGVDAEIENAELYDELFSLVDNEDITAVFTALRDASQNNHLPAFQRCGGRT